MAEHIEESYEKRGVPEDEAQSRAWATVNKETHGGQRKGGGGYGKAEDHASARKGGERGGRSPNMTAENRSAAAKKGWETRRRNAEKR